MRRFFNTKRGITFTKALFIFCLSTIILTSCEDVVDIDLNESAPRLVVEADIEVEKGSAGNQQTILLSQSTSYFNNQFVPVTNATVEVKNTATNEVFSFVHQANGQYVTNSFKPVFGNNYELKIAYNGETYTSVEPMVSVTPVTKIEQNTSVDFAGEEAPSLDFYTNDVAGVENFYLVEYKRSTEVLPYRSVWDDAFRDGNEIDFILRGVFTPSGESLEPGERVDIKYMGVSKGYATYMELLLEQVFDGGGPFSSIPVELKGNVINTTDNDRNAFGYFRLSEKETFSVTVK